MQGLPPRSAGYLAIGLSDDDPGVGTGMNMMRSDSGSDASQRIAAWVAASFTPATADGVTIYDLAP